VYSGESKYPYKIPSPGSILQNAAYEEKKQHGTMEASVCIIPESVGYANSILIQKEMGEE